MENIKGTRTEQNLMEAYANESKSSNKYAYYAKQAKKDGYAQIASLFSATADNEREHAKVWFKELHGGEVPETEHNLADAAAIEHAEWTEMYTRMAREAHEEGFTRIATLFEHVASIEREHESRYRRFLSLLNEHHLYKREEERTWQCTKCGYEHVGTEAPDVCPVCKHHKDFFRIKHKCGC